MRNSYELEQYGLEERDLRDRVMSVLYSELREIESQENKGESTEELLPEHIGFTSDQLETISLKNFTYGSDLVKKTVVISDYHFLKIGKQYMMAVLVRDNFHVDCNGRGVPDVFNFDKTEKVFQFFRTQLKERVFSTATLFEEREFGGMDEYLNGRKIVDRYTPFYIEISDPVDKFLIEMVTPQVGRDIIVLEED